MSKQEWVDKDGFHVRDYSSYDEYIEHQKSKLEGVIAWHKEQGNDFDLNHENWLFERLCNNYVLLAKMPCNVLCLAARLGGEVRAFKRLGCFTIGIDLNPGEHNKHVLEGDFHDIQFPTKSVDIVYTNSLDHILYPDKIFAEIGRVIKDDGVFITEFGTCGVGTYEAFDWGNVDNLIEYICEKGFYLNTSVGMVLPWVGQVLTFSKS